VADSIPFDEKAAELMLLGRLAPAWMHEVNNRLGGLNAILRDVLYTLDELSLPQEVSRRLGDQIGRAVDLSESAMKSLHLVQSLSRSDRSERAILAELLLRDTVKLLDPIARRTNCHIEVESTGSRRMVRIQERKYQQIIANILIFVMRHAALSDQPTRILISVPDADTVLITFEAPAPGELVSSASDYKSANGLRDPDKMELWMALKLIEQLGGSIHRTERDAKTVVAIKLSA
jgi:C4-dicarboxylate-specific signal transduction histidine kinase